MFIYKLIVCIFFIRFDYVIFFLIGIIVISVKGFFCGFVVKKFMGVNGEGFMSYVFKVDFYCIIYFFFYDWI